MPAVPSLRGRITLRKCFGDGIGRSYTGGSGRSPRKPHLARQTADESSRSINEKAANQDEAQKDNAGPSLYEQLFPDQHEADMKRQRASDTPRVPIKPASPRQVVWHPRRRASADTAEDVERSPSAQRLKRHMESQGSETTVLVLRNASKHLTEEDFKRIIPQGKHLPGWRLDQGDILRVVPGRDLETMEQSNHYYILFSSPLSAFTYQGHATRIHRIVASHTPASIHSAIPPPPGLMIDGMDAHSAIESFTLVPPSQSIDLRQLKPPLPPIIEQIIQCKGYRSLVMRKDSLPYQARITFEGPQLHLSAVRHVLLTTAKDRGLAWSGGEDLAPRLTKFERGSSDNHPAVAAKKLSTLDDSGNHDSNSKLPPETDQQKRRTPLLVYIAGFYTERAMQSFVHYWHRRPMEPDTGKRNSVDAADLPPIANVEVLW